jgi:AcrR family transcriptional regulator
MKSSPSGDAGPPHTAAPAPSLSAPAMPPVRLGLRERKKIKTRAAIQEQAMRLFRKRGWDATTVEQIADAAEVSPSTFFRYFPTKEDVVLYDATDPLMFASFEAQPPELTVIEALRRSFHAVYTGLSPGELAREQVRQDLIRTVPELRARMLDDLVGSIDMLAGIVAKRVGRSPDDMAVRSFSGALIGMIIGVFMAVDDLPATSYVQLFDDAMAQLEAGLPL